MSEKKARKSKSFEIKVPDNYEWWVSTILNMFEINKEMCKELNELSDTMFMSEWAKHLEDHYWSLREEQSNIAMTTVQMIFDANEKHPLIKEDNRLLSFEHEEMTFLENEKFELKTLLDESKAIFDNMGRSAEIPTESAQEIVDDIIANEEVYAQLAKEKLEEANLEISTLQSVDEISLDTIGNNDK